MTFIPQLQLLGCYETDSEALLDAARRVFESGWYILGKEVTRFEAAFAAFTGTAHGLGVANGTDAIELALRGLGVGPGDYVFTVSHTAVATVAAIERAGAMPVLVDIRGEDFCMDPESLASAFEGVATIEDEERCKAVIPVHLYGHPCTGLDAIIDFAREKNMAVVEDCAQAHGARVARGGEWKTVGSMGDVATFSFYPTKNLGAFGDGGFVATDDDGLQERMAYLRQYGWAERYISHYSGINSRLDEMQAAFLSVRLMKLADENARRREIAANFDEACKGNIAIQAPACAEDVEHVYHQYVVRVTERERFMTEMKEQGVGTAIHYPQAVHQQPAYAETLIDPVGLPVTEGVCREIVSLPMSPHLTDEQVGRICDALAGWK